MMTPTARSQALAREFFDKWVYFADFQIATKEKAVSACADLIDAARREALEEAARLFDACTCDRYYSNDAGFHRADCWMRLAAKIRALLSPPASEPEEGK
jgi:hypothetical protein